MISAESIRLMVMELFKRNDINGELLIAAIEKDADGIMHMTYSSFHSCDNDMSDIMKDLVNKTDDKIYEVAKLRENKQKGEN